MTSDTTRVYIAWLEEAARYFEGRPAGGEDLAHWANVANAEMARRIAADLTPRAAASETLASGNEEVAAKVEGDKSRAELPLSSSTPPTRPVAGEGETRPLLDNSDLANKATIDHPDAYLNALLTYTSDLYGDMLKAGRKPIEIVDAMQHIERAARGLHAKALARPPAEAWKPEREDVAKIVDPWPFGIVACISYNERAAVEREKAFAKADAILALQSPGAQTRDQRQAQAFDWMSAAFGPQTIVQRGVRLAEEAIEAAQAAEVPRDMLHKLVDHIYDRPAGDLRQELGGVGVTLLGLAAAAGLSADECEAAELARVLAKPLAFFAARNAAKNDAGFNADLPTPAKGRE